jgi:DNA polymerase-3 subunit epsilon
MREIIFDTETTGFKPEEGHRIVEIGAVEIVDLVPTGKTFHAYVNPQMQVPAGAAKVHGLTYDFLKKHRTIKYHLPKFLDFIGDAQLVAHNAAFDMRFVNAELVGLGWEPLTNPVVDTLELARQVKKTGRHSLDELCKFFKVEAAHRTLHGALLDSQLLAEVYLHLRGGRQRTLELVVAGTGEEYVKPDYGPRPFTSLVTEAERAAHLAFVESLGPTAIWNSYLRPEPKEEAA